MSAELNPETCITTLGNAHYDVVAPASFPQHRLRFRNQRWADRVGLGGLDDNAWLDHFARFRPLPGSLAQPLALRYHGHQFRSYNPDLGDGRGFLFAQLREPATAKAAAGRLLDLGTKGSGQTPWSRFGDGRLTLKGGVREVLATEMLEALGVNTSKSFSLVETGEALHRNDEPSPTRSSVLVRLSHSHIRLGMFQRLAFLDQPDELERLIDYTLANLLDLPVTGTLADRAARLLDQIAANAARLAASYMIAGFVHGVLNTDNINVTGESFDYGPWRFLPLLDAGFTAAYFDHGGLYAYGRQPEALYWNLHQLANALLLVAPREALTGFVEAFPPRYEAALLAGFLDRLGLAPHPEAAGLLASWEQALRETQLPPDRFFFDWYGGSASIARAERSAARTTYASAPFQPLREQLLRFEPATGVVARLGHPYFRGEEPCSLLIDTVEAIWAPIAAHDDWSAFEAKIAAIRTMGEALDHTP